MHRLKKLAFDEDLYGEEIFSILSIDGEKGIILTYKIDKDSKYVIYMLNADEEKIQKEEYGFPKTFNSEEEVKSYFDNDLLDLLDSIYRDNNFNSSNCVITKYNSGNKLITTKFTQNKSEEKPKKDNNTKEDNYNDNDEEDSDYNKNYNNETYNYLSERINMIDLEFYLKDKSVFEKFVQKGSKEGYIKTYVFIEKNRYNEITQSGILNFFRKNSRLKKIIKAYNYKNILNDTFGLISDIIKDNTKLVAVYSTDEKTNENSDTIVGFILNDNNGGFIAFGPQLENNYNLIEEAIKQNDNFTIENFKSITGLNQIQFTNNFFAAESSVLMWNNNTIKSRLFMNDFSSYNENDEIWNEYLNSLPKETSDEQNSKDKEIMLLRITYKTTKDGKKFIKKFISKNYDLILNHPKEQE